MKTERILTVLSDCRARAAQWRGNSAERAYRYANAELYLKTRKRLANSRADFMSSSLATWNSLTSAR